MSSKDKTLTDNNRREINLQDYHPVKEILPSYFQDQYPKFIKFLENYYDFMDSDQSPSKLIDDLFLSRDITAVDLELLNFIEDELLLGTQYFEGFTNKRAAAKYSNTLYRSKGSLYSIQQFFRTFFSISPDVVYTKKNIFEIGVSEIGPESLRYITDNKLYQKYAILIKAAIPINEWLDAYKLFVHPSGMYIGGEVQILSNNTSPSTSMPIAVIDETAQGLVIQGEAAVTFITVPEIVGNSLNDSGNNIVTDLNNMILHYQHMSIAELHNNFDDLSSLVKMNSMTMDNNSKPTMDMIGYEPFNWTNSSTSFDYPSIFGDLLALAVGLSSPRLIPLYNSIIPGTNRKYGDINGDSDITSFDSQLLGRYGQQYINNTLRAPTYKPTFVPGDDEYHIEEVLLPAIAKELGIDPERKSFINFADDKLVFNSPDSA